jgi:hypothetical protein
MAGSSAYAQHATRGRPVFAGIPVLKARMALLSGPLFCGALPKWFFSAIVTASGLQ